jgi:hypothetical protein
MGTYVAGYSEQASGSVVATYEGTGWVGADPYGRSLEDRLIEAEDAVYGFEELIAAYREDGLPLQPGYLEGYREACRRRNALRARLEA